MHNVIPKGAILLFIYTSLIMFVLRLFAGPIVERINPRFRFGHRRRGFLFSLAKLR